MKKILILFLSLLPSACRVGPDYEKPSMEVPEKWENAPPQDKNKNRDILSEVVWWKNYNDPILTHLIEETIKSNHDLKTAFAQIFQARASLLGAEAAFSPNVDGVGSYNNNENSLTTNTTSNISSISPNIPPIFQTPGLGQPRFFNIFNLGLSVNWEIDLFGRLQRGIESAEASVESQVEDMHSLMLSLIAETAVNYITLRGRQKLIEIQKKTVENWDFICKLNEDLLSTGLITEIDLNQAKADRNQVEAYISVFETDIKVAIHHLSILTGRPPAYFYKLLLPVKPIPQLPSEIFAGLPCELLLRRPDIREAERTLAASTAQIGVAIGDLFPNISLTGTPGFQSNFIRNFINPRSLYYTIGPQFSWGIIDFGQVRSNIYQAISAKDQNYHQYISTILKALEDVENSLVTYANEAKRYAILQESYNFSDKALELSKLRFNAGLLNYITVLQNEIDLQEDALIMVQSQTSLAIDSVLLYKSLGGGWQVDQTAWTQKEPITFLPYKAPSFTPFP
ncbi:MAG: TolC family protein [Alphaproteobacteria bacterium]|nr:TolC family protein [Alphaproteobacteria bacterium]MBP7729238.1 TolC family protein [Alphaproteobacteria bacterium]